MNKLVALLQVLVAVILGMLALATLVNMVLISTRPETISVINAIIGQVILIVFLLAMATISMRKGLNNLRQARDSQENQE